MYYKHRSLQLHQSIKIFSIKKEKGKNSERKRKYVISQTDVLKYISHTQFHGAKMLADGESRWYWVPAMLLLLICACTVVYLSAKRFHENAIYLTVKESTKAVLRFPSVSVCPEISFRKCKQEQFLLTTSYPDSLNETYISTVLHQLGAFFSPDVLYKVQDLENLEKFLSFNNIDVVAAGKRLTTTCEETLLRCQFDNINYNCSQIFRMELTGDGFCCVFNGRSLSREIKEHGLKNIVKTKPKWKTSRTGANSGLMIAVDQTQEAMNIDLSYKWMFLQSGQSFVDISVNGTPLNPGTEQWMIYRLRSFYITEQAKILRPGLRKCELSEQGSTYFPVYRKRYCILECEMENTIKLCNCVRRVHPNPFGVPYCRAKDLMCASHAKAQLGGMFNVFFGGSFITILALLGLAWKIFASGCTIFLESVSKEERIMHYEPAIKKFKYK